MSLKQAKYRNLPTNGYHSKREAKRAQELHLLLTTREITDLREQVRFELLPGYYQHLTTRQVTSAGAVECLRPVERAQWRCIERPVAYVADFAYYTGRGEYVVEDVKGYATDVYILKRKLMLRLHHIRVTEV